MFPVHRVVFLVHPVVFLAHPVVAAGVVTPSAARFCRRELAYPPAMAIQHLWMGAAARTGRSHALVHPVVFLVHPVVFLVHPVVAAGVHGRDGVRCRGGSMVSRRES